MQSVYQEAGLYLLQGFQQLSQSNDGDHHNPSRDDASNLKDTHFPSTEFSLLPHVSQRAGCVHHRAHSQVYLMLPDLLLLLILLREIRIIC